MIHPYDRRFRLIYISGHQILDWFTSAAKSWIGRKELMLPIVSGLPKDTQVLAVYYDHQRAAFQFTIHSATFSEVPCGQEIPQWEGDAPMRYEVIELRTDADREREVLMQRPPRIWYFKDPSEDSKAAVLKVADEQIDRTNVLMPVTIPSQPTFERSGREVLKVAAEQMELALGAQGFPGASGGIGCTGESQPMADAICDAAEADEMLRFFKGQ